MKLKSIELTKPALLNDVNALFAAFRVHFSDPNLSASSLQNLRKKGPCPPYKVRLIAFLAHVDPLEEWKIDMFKVGLNHKVRDALAVTSLRRSSNDGGRCRHRQRVARESHTRAHARALPQVLMAATATATAMIAIAQSYVLMLTAIEHSSTSIAVPSGVVPMEVDATHIVHGRRDDKERQRHRDLDLLPLVRR